MKKQMKTKGKTARRKEEMKSESKRTIEKTAKVIVNGEVRYDTLETWFVVFPGQEDESWLNVFYEE